MAEAVHKPLSRVQWVRELRDLTQTCARAPVREQEMLIRRMRDLLARVPEHEALGGLAMPRAPRMEALFDAGCWDSAALAMLGEDAGYLLSRGEGGHHLASVLLPGRLVETVCGGSTLALALVGAMASALAEGPVPAYSKPGAKRPHHLH